MTMTPEKTNYITQGYDGLKRLRQGPNLDSYRGLNIIHSRQYSLETGAPPRDLLRRRVRVAEYYRIPPPSLFVVNQVAAAPNAPPARPQVDQERINNLNIELYDESKDTFFTTTWKELLLHAALDEEDRAKMIADIAIAQTEFRDIFAVLLRPDAALAQNIPVNAVDLMLALRGDNAAAAGAFVNPPQPAGVQARDAAVLGGSLILRSRAIQQAWDAGAAGGAGDARRAEIRSFYYASGLHDGTNRVPYQQTFQGGRNVFAANIGGRAAIIMKGQNPAADNARDRRRLFSQLMRGRVVNGNWQDVRMGMRPNVHVGNMVFSTMKPDSIRFVHVAANIFAQTVVTRSLATRLMMQLVGQDGANVGQRNANDNKLLLAHRVLSDLFNIAPTDDQVYFGVDTSVLVFIVGAALHPNADVRIQCKDVLKTEIKLDLDELAGHLVTWLKLFIHGAPKFNAFEQVLPHECFLLLMCFLIFGSCFVMTQDQDPRTKN